ncbi:MAG: LPS-assembly protein LptD [Rickettsiales bacterium]|nr:LPS-assembly protein LptD [Rickettsiales bacterium]
MLWATLPVALMYHAAHSADLKTGLRPDNSPAAFEADDLGYEAETGDITASGNVEVTQGKRKLKADSVSYNQKTRMISAKGNIELKDPAGHTFFADSAELEDSLEKGHIDNMAGLLSGSTYVAATEAERQDKDHFSLKNFFFTPCNICNGRTQRTALWNLRAGHVKLDQQEQSVKYKDAYLEIFGTPVLYTPYLSHPMPDATRKSGILMPSYKGSNTLGASVKVPYYISIAENKDATIAPIFTTEEGIVMTGEYRHLTRYGQYELRGSITNPKERDVFGNEIEGRKIRGHIEGIGHFNFENSWSAGFNAKRSSDDTYLQRYSFDNEDLLTSRGYVQRIEGRDYIGMQAYSFQGLNADDDPDTTPLILPLIDTHIERPTGYANSMWTWDANALSLLRGEGADSRRLSSTLAWVLPHITPGGHILNLITSVRGDVYHVQNVPDPLNSAKDQEGLTGRFMPEAKLAWNYPVMQNFSHARVMLEPMAEVILSPYGNNPNKIPNEDSQQLELSDFNLFSSNHYTGLDRVEGGPRTNYGVRGGIYRTKGPEHITFLLGQNYRTKKDANFAVGSGLDDNFSDYVGRITASNGDNMDVSYRFRVDKDDGSFRRNEVLTTLQLSPLSLRAGYVQLDDETTFIKEEALANISYRFTDDWTFFANGRRDLADNGGWIETGAGIAYENECLIISTALRREYVRDRDIEPNTSVVLEIGLKHLGI